MSRPSRRRTYLQGWTSPNSNEASVIASTATSTGYKGCANNQAETSGSGDNNGYETTPGNACAPDGAVAAFRVRITDVSSNNARDFRLDYVGVQVHYTP